MIRLSICIATLNRAAFIGATLDTILPQLTEAVEVVIVDGASTDGTDTVVAAHFAGRSNCRFHRLAEKGGVDRDYCRAVTAAQGDFCWLMTDDDLLKPGAVTTILEQLREEPDLLVVNAEVANQDLSANLIPKKMSLERNRDFGVGEQAGLLALAGDMLSFIGAVVIRRSLWESREREAYFGTEFIHVGVIFQKPLDRFARVLAEPLLRIRYGNAQWTSRAFEIWMFKWPGLIWSFAHLPEEAKAAVCRREPWKDATPLLMMKARGCFTYRDYRSRLSARPMRWWTRMKVAAIAAFPDALFNCLLTFSAPVFFPRAKGLRLELRQSPFDYRKRWFGDG